MADHFESFLRVLRQTRDSPKCQKAKDQDSEKRGRRSPCNIELIIEAILTI